jgi:hypothetical protein
MTDVLPTGAVHPVAELFPMLPDDELAELAEDIRINGLQQPIVLDEDGTLIDGRNRWAACQMVSVEPRFVTLNGADPVAYILSANVHRRHISAGQRAMIAVVALGIDSEDFLRSKNAKEIAARMAAASQARISQARTVGIYAPELADQVRAGTLSLNEAYEEAKDLKAQRESREKAAAESAKTLAMLREVAPDLAELVDTEQMPLREALAAWRERDREDHERRERATRTFATDLADLWSLLMDNPEGMTDDWLPEANPLARTPHLDFLWTAEGVRRMSRLLDRLAIALDERGGSFA